MNKKWRNVIIISMVILVLEVAGSLFFLLPYYKLQRVFKTIDAGQWTQTQDYFNALSEAQQEKALSYMDGYGAYLSERYINGELTYLQVSASFDAINSITEDSEIFDKYTPDINRNEYVKLVNQLYEANLAKNTEKKYENIADITDIQNRIAVDDREAILVELLNKNLDRYIRHQISYEDLRVFTKLVAGMSINTAYNYAYTVAGYAVNINNYRDSYKSVESMMAAQDYIGVLELIDGVFLYDFDPEYYELYTTAYQTAYDTGKEYYVEVLRGYIDAGDTQNAVALMANLEGIYGTDIDLDFAKDAMMVDWQKACVARLEDWEPYLKAQLDKDNTGKYILENEYDNLRPDSIALYDINEDGYPELCMFNSARLEDDYVGTFILGYNQSEYVYMGYVNIISFGIKKNIVAFPICFGRDAGEEVCLYNYDGESLTQGSIAQKFGEQYYVDGEEAIDIDYMSAQTAIMLNQDVTRIQNSGYVPMDKFKEYIIEYKNEYEPAGSSDTDETSGDSDAGEPAEEEGQND